MSSREHGRGGRWSDRRQNQSSRPVAWPVLQQTSGGRGVSVSGGRGRGRGGRSSDQRQDQSSGPVAWPGLQQTSGGRGVSVSGGRGRGNVGRGDSTGGPTASLVVPSVGSSSKMMSVASPSKEESKVTKVSDSAVALAKLQITPTEKKLETTLPQRPWLGTLGEETSVRANHFLVSFPDRNLHHYSVSITPEVISKTVKWNVMRDLVQRCKKNHLAGKTPAYDGDQALYTAGALPFESKKFFVNLREKRADGSSGRWRQFTVGIKLVSRSDLNQLLGIEKDAPDDVIQALNVVLKDYPSDKYVSVDRYFFHASFEKGELGYGIEYWRGYFQSLRPTQMGLSLNIDVSSTSFYEAILVTEFIRKFLNISEEDLKNPLTDSDRLKVEKVLRKLKVTLLHWKPVRSAKISGISKDPIRELSFTSKDNSEKKVIEYFKDRHAHEVIYPSLPAIQTGRRTYVPMELCKIAEGQRYTKTLNDNQVAALLSATCQRPDMRENSIKNMVLKNNYNNLDLVREFGMTVTDTLTSVRARVLPPPMLKYHDSGIVKTVTPSQGKWNMLNTKMYEGANVDSWTCVNFGGWIDQRAFCKKLIEMCDSKGMQFNPYPVIPFITSPPQSIEVALHDIHKRAPGIKLLIVILPDDVTGSYGKIKRICETELGIVSQCFQRKQAANPTEQCMENVALKINVKTGGRNTVLHDNSRGIITDLPTIIMGADVTHSQSGEDSSPSIAAVVASMDWPETTKYRGLVSAQAPRQEIIQDSGLIKEHLEAFIKATGIKPSRIIFYRDGVGEGQFSQVLLLQVNAIRKACNLIEVGYLPPITFVIVQKRHHTRLFPEEQGGNILPGTVVDTDICHPRNFDFYLNSHAAIRGTNRPAYYHVVFDENGFSADELQTLTNNLCYTFARCTSSVSIVPPVYYAHLAAYRARYYMERDKTKSADPVASKLPAIKDNVKEVMFYC